jgi:hypothetical protein
MFWIARWGAHEAFMSSRISLPVFFDLPHLEQSAAPVVGIERLEIHKGDVAVGWRSRKKVPSQCDVEGQDDCDRCANDDGNHLDERV